MPKPITAISIKFEAKDALIEALDLNNVPIKDIIDRFDRTIFVFRRSAYVMAARMHCSEIDDSDFRALDMAEFREIKLAAAPKKDMYNRREATFARARYDRLHARADRTIRFKPKRAAHKGWVTKNEFKYLASEGRQAVFRSAGYRHRQEGLLDFPLLRFRRFRVGPCASAQRA